LQPPEAIATTWQSGGERQRLEINLGILPDLGIDQAAEQPFEQPLQKPFAGERAVAPDGLFQADMALGPRFDHSHPLRIDSLRDIYATIDAILMTAVVMLAVAFAAPFTVRSRRFVRAISRR